MGKQSRWWTVLYLWHDWRAAVWFAVRTRETKTHVFCGGGTWTSVSMLGMFAEQMAEYHASRAAQLRPAGVRP